MRRITWARANWGAVGKVNGVRVFSVAWGSSGDPQRQYVLHADLPGISDSKYASEGDAQEAAETVLVLCLNGLGATFP